MVRTVIHGIDCKKQFHTGSGGYLHGEGDDSPYDVDGLSYCGRCHTWLDVPWQVDPKVLAQVEAEIDAVPLPVGQEIHCDCFCYGKNPSDIGGGFTITNATGVVLWREEILKKGFTNNEGELLGVLYALMIAAPGDTVVTDSQNTVAWVKSGMPRARPDLVTQASLAKKLVEIKGCRVEWRRREENAAGRYNEKRNAKGPEVPFDLVGEGKD